MPQSQKTKCMDLFGSTAQHAKAGLGSCTSGQSQQFFINPDGTAFRLIPRLSGLTMDSQRLRFVK